MVSLNAWSDRLQAVKALGILTLFSCVKPFKVIENVFYAQFVYKFAIDVYLIGNSVQRDVILVTTEFEWSYVFIKTLNVHAISSMDN